MKTTFRFAGWLALAALIIFGTAATYQTGSPFPRLADTTGNPIRVGAGLNITNRWLYATGTGGGGTGSVSSVGLTMPGGFSVSGSPVTTSGTLAVTTALTNIIKGTGSGFSNAVAGVDYQLPGNYITALSGAVVGSGPGTATTTLASTGVTNGVYGSATMVPQINVGSNGLILGATNVTITGVSPGGSAGGSLTGTYPNPTLASNTLAGTYRSVTVLTNGLVSTGTNPTTFSGYGISDTSANLAAALSDETGGTGVAVFNNGATLSNSVTLATGNLNVAAGNITNSGSITSGGLILANVATGTSTAFATTNIGAVASPAITIGYGTSVRNGFYMSSTKFVISQIDQVGYAFREGGLGPVLKSTGSYRWTSTSDPSDGNDDLLLQRDSTATLQLGGDGATAIAQTIKAHDGSGTDKDGAKLTIEAGQSTGTGRGGDLALKTSVTSTNSNSTANSYTTREYIGAKYVDLTKAGTNTLCTILCTTNNIIGLNLLVTVYCGDGTDLQSQSRTTPIDAINKAGAIDAKVDNSRTNATAGTVGTLGYTVLAEASNNTNVLIRVAADTSLTPGYLRAKWSILGMNSDGVGTVTPQ